MLKWLSMTVLAALTLACADERPILKVEAGGTSFQRELVPSVSTLPIAVVPYDSWNRGNATAFVPTCGSRALPVIEKLVNGRWESYASGFCMLSIVMVPLELREGEIHHDEVAVSEAGRFRIRLPYSSDAQMGKRFEAVSSPFDVK